MTTPRTTSAQSRNTTNLQGQQIDRQARQIAELNQKIRNLEEELEEEPEEDDGELEAKLEETQQHLDDVTSLRDSLRLQLARRDEIIAFLRNDVTAQASNAASFQRQYAYTLRRLEGLLDLIAPDPGEVTRLTKSKES